MRKLLSVIAIAAVLSACGKSEEEKAAEKAAEDLKKAAESVASAAAQAGTAAAAQGTGDMAKAMQSMAAALGGGDGKTVDPVSTDTIKSALPSISGWEMEAPDVERMTSPIPFSSAETDYKQGDKEIRVKVVDSGFAQMLIAPWAMFMASGYSREDNEGYEKSTTVAGHPGFERWRTDRKRGELNIFVNKRFLVTIEADDIADTRVLHDFASKMDLGRIGALK